MLHPWRQEGLSARKEGSAPLFKFDTRDVKPKVWNIAVVSVIAAVVLGIMISRQAAPAAVAAVVAVYLLMVIVFLLAAFVMQLQYNPYSYNTLYYSGLAIFLFSAFVTDLSAIHFILKSDIKGMDAAFRLFSVFEGSARTYMLYSLPFILVYSAALCISNISLIRHEGKRLVNLLGIILAFLLVGGEAFLFFGNYYVSGSETEVMIHDLLFNLFAAFYLYFECMLIGTIIANVIVVRYEPEKDKDYLIILGCGIRKDGTPTPLLAGRIDRAVRFAKEQEALTGKVPVFVTSGGKGPDEVTSESEAMKNYLLERGIPEKQILEEDRSTSTFENMQFSKKLIDAEDPKAKVAFSTTNYHVFRSGLMARRVKMRAVGIGARTKWYFWPNAAVREFVGLLTEHRIKQGLILGGMIASYIIATVVAYKVI